MMPAVASTFTNAMRSPRRVGDVSRAVDNIDLPDPDRAPHVLIELNHASSSARDHELCHGSISWPCDRIDVMKA